MFYNNHNRYGQQLTLPPGWVDCPDFSGPFPVVRDSQGIVKVWLPVVASKVPLSGRYDPLIPASHRYTLLDALKSIEQRTGCKVGLIIDLTNSDRYYQFNELPHLVREQVAYAKVRCRGRGESPEPASVNHAVWEMWRFMEHDTSMQREHNAPPRLMMVHCTHGFNRSGYVIVSALVRLMGMHGMTVERSIKRFAEFRPPGIYKNSYIEDLFRYYHEDRNYNKVVTPPVPDWKRMTEGEDDDDANEDHVPADSHMLDADLRHDRIEDIGELIPAEEEEFIKGLVYMACTGRQHEGHLRFPGSQPVSLAHSNIGLVESQKYSVSWKADGTRYLMWMDVRGCYLVDRSFKVRRLQMRFPTRPKDDQKKAFYPVGQPHRHTLVDGEMVVDIDKTTGKQYRRYLIYDLPYLSDMSMIEKTWVERYNAIDPEIVKPRTKERDYIASGKKPGDPGCLYQAEAYRYRYDLEAFSVRRKEFYPLFEARKLVHKLIPELCHESDGLILQGQDVPYVANTDASLLKWKFAHLNSVDFLLKVDDASSEKTNCSLLLVDTSSGRRMVGGRGQRFVAVEDVHVFLEDEDPLELNGRIIECTWDEGRSAWKFMRVREDKDLPNASHVYCKVVDSIYDNIQEDELLSYLETLVAQHPLYEKDRQAAMMRGQQLPAVQLPSADHAAALAAPYEARSPPYQGPFRTPDR